MFPFFFFCFLKWFSSTQIVVIFYNKIKVSITMNIIVLLFLQTLLIYILQGISS
jgi:hypothetical protein